MLTMPLISGESAVILALFALKSLYDLASTLVNMAMNLGFLAAQDLLATMPSNVGTLLAPIFAESVMTVPVFLISVSAGGHTYAASMWPRCHAATIVGGCMLRIYDRKGVL